MTAENPLPSGAPPSSAAAPRRLLLLVPVLALWGWALAFARPETLPSVLAAGAASLLLGVVLALLLAARDRRVATLGAELERVRAESAALASDTLPRLVARLSEGDSAETALHRSALPQDPGAAALLRLAATEIATAQRRRAAAMAACATAAGRVQALTTTMLADLRRMQERHGDGAGGPDVLGDLMHLDHTTAQAGRTADSIAVLTGARSGRRWSRSIPMESVLRGAMGRIGAYQRVRTHGFPPLAVAGFAAEGVIHALAELLDNAATFSPPTAEVHVHVEEVQAGVAIMVEDGGLVMGEEALRRARHAVGSGMDIAALSGTRLGLAVVGRLAQRYGLSVSFRSSSRGGTGVVLLLPQRLIKPLPAPAAPSAPAPDTQHRTAVHPSGAPTAPARTPSPVPADEPAPRLVGGLPQRRRGRTLAAVERTRPAPADTGPPTSATGFGAFRSAVRGQRPADAPKDT
ncbi:ATP-binding protein [Nocardiopsis sp. MG754419]|uniref:ATP-binding protein n=1 Tax=Nocardiopsis sp. MG754419 TaxID=2259865 RepID=UPI001BA9C75E|nr:ATP-binding protein [Nocardiopsis sp. MG754419]MBR8743722.1 ATP-binding protein [Nocardiopsis sp. MG754419]